MELKNKIVLKDKNESAVIPMKDLVATLRWKDNVDLDLHAYFQKKDGKDGHVYFGSMGSLNNTPFISLDKDDGVGDKGGDNEENLRFADLSNIKHVLIVADIYGKSNAVFSKYDGSVIVSHSDQSFEVPLTSNEQGSKCIVAHINNSGLTPKLINVNRAVKDVPSIENFLTGNFQAGAPSNSARGGVFGRIFGGN